MTADELSEDATIRWSEQRNKDGSIAAGVDIATRSAYKDRLKEWRTVALWPPDQLQSLEESLGDKRSQRKQFEMTVKTFRQQDGKSSTISDTDSASLASAAASLAGMTSSSSN